MNDGARPIKLKIKYDDIYENRKDVRNEGLD